MNEISVKPASIIKFDYIRGNFGNSITDLFVVLVDIYQPIKFGPKNRARLRGKGICCNTLKKIEFKQMTTIAINLSKDLFIITNPEI
ncbi:MAG: hypothetical protein CMM83_06515 [Rhodospirillales bacterium]|nr:hypothetical protein [Rhodospirillales bacterium]